MKISICARIMHIYSRPSPTEIVRSLELFGDVLTIVDDVGRGPWATAKRCWLSGADSSKTHTLVIQDDAMVANGAAEQMVLALEARPNDVVSFFYHNHEGAQKAGGAPFIEFPISNWGVCLAMPSSMARNMVAWNDENISPSVQQDDLRVLHYACNHGLKICATNPSLCEHRPEFASTVSPRGNNREFLASRLYRGEHINWALPAYQAPGDTRAFLISRQHQRATG